MDTDQGSSAVPSSGWLLSPLLAAAFLTSGCLIVAGGTGVREAFALMGLPDWLRAPVGLVHVLGALGLVLPATRRFTAGFLGGLMALTMMFVGATTLFPLVFPGAATFFALMFLAAAVRMPAVRPLSVRS